jgi:hypothetical protein
LRSGQTKIRTELARDFRSENDDARLGVGLFENWIWKEAIPPLSTRLILRSREAASRRMQAAHRGLMLRDALYERSSHEEKGRSLAPA